MSERFLPGDLVEAGGERWNVDDFHPATSSQPAHVTVGRSLAADEKGWVRADVRDFPASEVRLITPFLLRSVIITREDSIGLWLVRDKGGDVLAIYLDEEIPA